MLKALLQTLKFKTPAQMRHDSCRPKQTLQTQTFAQIATFGTFLKNQTFKLFFFLLVFSFF